MFSVLSPQVQLLRWEGPRGGGNPEVHDMERGIKGTWSLPVPLEWEGTYYKYRCPYHGLIQPFPKDIGPISLSCLLTMTP